MVRNTQSTINKNKLAKNLSYSPLLAARRYPTLTLSMSFVVGMVSLGVLLLWQRLSSTAALMNPDIQTVHSVTSSYPDAQRSSYGIQFLGITPLALSAAIAYQTGSHVIGLVSTAPFWLATDVYAQALPPLIDFNLTLPTNFGLVLQGAMAGDIAGSAISNAGDVDGDGKSDFLIGASSYPNGRAGIAYLIYGGRSLSPIFDLGNLTAAQGIVIQGGAVGDYAGNAVASAGDVDGDGKDDFLIGAWQAHPYGRGSAGAAYLIYGAANLPAMINLGDLSTLRSVTLQGAWTNDNVGYSVSGAGDVNGDGKVDFLVGAVNASPAGRAYAGAVYLVYGGVILPAIFDLRNMNSTQGVMLQGGAAYNTAGWAVANAGDVNGDGKSDFLIGAQDASPAGRTQAGAAYLIYGSKTLPSLIDLGNLTSTQGMQLFGAAANDNVGNAISGAGDVNGDGKDDFLVGAPTADSTGRKDAGAVYLIYGGINLPGTIDLGNSNASQVLVLLGGAAGDNAGRSVSDAGDINGDGKADFLVGAFHASPKGRTQAGGAYLIYGGANLPLSLDLKNISSAQGVTMQGGSADDNFGRNVLTVDINGDGGKDIFIGAAHASPDGRISAGVAYLIYGAPHSTPSLITNTTSTALTPTITTQLSTEFTQSALITNVTTDSIGLATSRNNLLTTTATSKASTTVGTALDAEIGRNKTSHPTTILEEKAVDSTPSIPTVVGGVAGSVVVLGVALAAYGFWRNKRKPVSDNTDTESPLDNRYPNKQADINNSSDGDLKSMRDSSEKYEILKPPAQTNDRSSSASSNYAKIDEFKRAAKEYDHAPTVVADDLKMSH